MVLFSYESGDQTQVLAALSVMFFYCDFKALFTGWKIYSEPSCGCGALEPGHRGRLKQKEGVINIVQIAEQGQQDGVRGAKVLFAQAGCVSCFLL